MFNETWSAKYKEHSIKVNNSWFGPSKLYVDGKLQDIITGLFSARLFGKIIDNGKEKELRISITSTLFSMECNIFIDNELIYSSNK